MKLSRTDETSLAAMGVEPREMLVRRDYLGLASRFGYALARGRDPAEAIESDFLSASAAPHASIHSQDVRVKYFKPNATGLFAVVECDVHVDGGNTVLLELVVAGQEERHIAIEGISGTNE